MKILYKLILNPKNSRLQTTQLVGLAIGIFAHITFIGLFLALGAYALMWFNILVSIPVFVFSFILSYKGKPLV